MGPSQIAVRKLNRRQWAARIGVAALAVPVAAQVTQKNPPRGAPAPPASPATPEQRLQKAYADIRALSAQLSGIQVPMDVEPAFTFRAL